MAKLIWQLQIKAGNIVKDSCKTFEVLNGISSASVPGRAALCVLELL